MKIIDLSKTIYYKKEDPWFMRIKVKNTAHQKAMHLSVFFSVYQKNSFLKVLWAEPTIKAVPKLEHK